MFTIYVYILDTLADWELGYVTAELNSRRFFKEGAQSISIKTVSCSKEPITTMGGLKVIPDCLVEDVAPSKKSMILLPGADTWSDPKHDAILEKAKDFLSEDAPVCAICGATVALAGFGLLDNRWHTSNGPGFLEMFVPTYKGQSFYVNQPSIADKNLITASGTGALLWAKQIIEYLGVFQLNTLDAWYKYFSTGDYNQFFALIETLPQNSEK